MTSPAAFDGSYSGDVVHWVDDDGALEVVDTASWNAPAGPADMVLFIDPCTGPTIDVGCGPGRLAAELAVRGLTSLGVDTSQEAVRTARERGAQAVQCDVFGPVPDAGRWSFALLADGNIGIGGDPVALLRRVATLLAPGGRIVVEVEDAGVGWRSERRRLRIDGRDTAAFDWAVVGLDAVPGLAARAGLVVVSVRTIGGRHAAVLEGRP